MILPKKGARVRMTGIMPDDPAPMAIGDEGTVTGTYTGFEGRDRAQIHVAWDNGRTLILLASDPFEVVAP